MKHRDTIDLCELRQGNFVAIGCGMTRVGTIRQRMIETWDANMHKETVRGMPLTADILQDFGFVRGVHSHMAEIWDIPLHNTCFRLLSASPHGDYWFFMIREHKQSISLNYHHYVHELQNLYHSIHKRELQYTGKWGN